jgi:putative sigma-54 modulation protein
MNISFTFRHMDGSDAIKSHTEEKLAKLQKFLRQAMTGHVTVSIEGLDAIADVQIQAGGSSFHAKERSSDMYASIDLVVDKIERQIHDNKASNVARKHGAMSAGEFAVVAERESQRGTRG